MNLVSKLLAPLCSLIALTGCSAVDVLNFTIPKSGYTVDKDIAYGADKSQKLDVYIPDTKRASGCVVLFFYGGSWQTGSKDNYLFAGEAFSSLGCVTVLAEYRRYPEVKYPVFLQDSAKALAWTHAHVGEYGGRADNIFVAGHSAGAYNAMMLAADTSLLKAEGGTPGWIRGVIGIAGPYDFLPFIDDKIKDIFSTVKAEDTQPVNYVHANMPPVLMATGTKDKEVLPRNTRLMAAKMEKFGNKPVVKMYEGAGHVGIALSLARGFRNKTPVLQDSADFITQHEKK